MAITVEEALEHANSLVDDYYDQKELMEDMDAMYFLEWDDKPAGKEFKFTTSPTARNTLLGAIRLMSSTEPNFIVPFDKNNDTAKRQSEKIEKICKTIWYHSGRFRGVPLEQPAVESLLRYGMMVLAITPTESLKDIFIRDGASKAQIRQIERLVESTPYLIEAWDPKGVYPEWGRFGLTAVYREVEMTLAEAIQQFGEKPVEKVLGDKVKNLNDRVWYADYWNLDKHIAWITGTYDGIAKVVAGEPIVDKEHGLPCIPIVVQTSEGSYIDAERDRQALPFLYTVKKSGLWERQNLELTVLYTNMFDLAANPTYEYQTISEDGQIDIDYSVPGGVVRTRPGEYYRLIPKDVFNKDMMHGLTIANQLVEESTIHQQALGGTGGLGANTAFSTVSLLNQVGRLPLTAPQKRGGWGIGTALELVMEMIKDSGDKQKLKSREGFIDFDPDEIPDDLIIEARLEVSLPQDQLTQANVATYLTQSGLASRRWARENILQIGQSEEMEKEIWDDQAAAQEYQKTLMKFQQMEMMAQQQMMGQQGQQPPMPPGMEGEMRGPASPGSAMQTQAGMIPAQRPGMKPVPMTAQGAPMQEGEVPG
jgi:hypothetical protein